MSNVISPYIIQFGEHMYRVHQYDGMESLEEGNAYQFGGKLNKSPIQMKYVLPYRGKYSKNITEPGIYIRKQDVFIKYPTTEVDIRMYHTNRIFGLNSHTIQELNEYFTDVTSDELKTAGEVFEPVVKETDDTGFRAIRLGILAKQVPLAGYLAKLSKTSDRANYKKALTNDSSMTNYKLDQYVDMFELDYGIIMFDKAYAKDPMSSDGKAFVVFNGTPYPINDPNIVTIETLDDLKSLNE